MDSKVATFESRSDKFLKKKMKDLKKYIYLLSIQALFKDVIDLNVFKLSHTKIYSKKAKFYTIYKFNCVFNLLNSNLQSVFCISLTFSYSINFLKKLFNFEENFQFFKENFQF